MIITPITYSNLHLISFSAGVYQYQRISGTAEPGAEIEVFIDDRLVGSTTTHQGGSWSINFTSSLLVSNGSHIITASAMDQVRNRSPLSSPVTITVDSTAPPTPIIMSPANGTITNSRDQVISGIAEAFSRIDIIIDNTPAGSKDASQDGLWSFGAQFTNGSHIITAKASDQADNASPSSSPVTITIDTTAPPAPIITSPANGDLSKWTFRSYLKDLYLRI